MDYVTNHVTVGGVRLACRVDGPEDAPAIVFLNSLGCDLRMWDYQVEALSPNFRVIRYDMPGHGQSGDAGETATIERLGQDVLAVLDHFDTGRAHVCGLSLGGMVAMWLSALHPERVGSAVFADTAARIGSVELWNERIEAVRKGGLAGVREIALGRFLSEGFQARRPEMVSMVREMLDRTTAAGYITACAALRDADLREIAPGIRIPSLIITGELDQATPPGQAEELHSAIAGSEIAVLPEAAHLSNIEQPELFNACLLAFLTR